MLVKVDAVLSKEEVCQCRRVLEAAPWVDGKVTAGAQSAIAKYNLQVPEDAPEARELGDLVLRALGRSATFYSAVLPLKVFPPLFNRYDAGMKFDAHVDNAIRFVTGASGRIRTDVSSTLFLSEPDEYDGGELVIQDTYGEQKIKFGRRRSRDLSRHQPSSRRTDHARLALASFFWTQSMVKDDGQRALLYGFDEAIRDARGKLGDEDAAVLALTATYHNLLRRWVEM
ncbi:MAG: Fe2+-dependent dioxygenase [Terricaulis sp.]